MEEKLFDANFWNGLQRIRLAEGQRLSGGRSGGRRSKSRGSSVEFADFREYMPGDDIRRIDWNAYGRTDRLFVKLFMQEQEGIYTVIVDTSASMNFGAPTKAVMASRLAGAFGYMVLQANDRVRLASVHASATAQSSVTRPEGQMDISGQTEPQVQVEAGLTGMQSLSRYLTQIEKLEFAGRTDLWNSIRRISFPRRGCTIVLSDFMDTGADPSHMDQIAQVLKYLQFQKQDVILLHIMAEEELHPQLQGTLDLVDEETKEALKVTATEKLLAEYGKQVEAYRLELQKLAKRYQAHWIEVVNTETITQVVYQGIRGGCLEL